MCTMALNVKLEVLYCEYVNEQEFSGAWWPVLPDTKVSLYAPTPAYKSENIAICSYPNLSKELISQERPCCSQRETPDFKNASYQYRIMFTMKWFDSFLWKCQLRTVLVSNTRSIPQQYNRYLNRSSWTYTDYHWSSEIVACLVEGDAV